MSKKNIDPVVDLSDADVEKVFSTVEIPACPATAVAVMTEAQKEAPDPRKLIKAVSGDIGMSAMILKLANSPMFRAGAPAPDVKRALDRIGTRNLVCVVVAAALRESMNGLPADFIERFWNRTATVALAAGLAAKRLYGMSPDEAYTYGLFHDAGIPVMLRRFPEYARMLDECIAQDRLVVDAETGYFPSTHPVVGSLLVRNWGLPPVVGQAIRFHHVADVYDLPDSTLSGASLSLIAATHVVEHMLSQLTGEKDIEVGERLFGRAVTHLGIGQEDLEQLREDVDAATIEARR